MSAGAAVLLRWRGISMRVGRVEDRLFSCICIPKMGPGIFEANFELIKIAKAGM